MYRVIRKLSLPVVVVGLVAIFAIAGSSLILAIGYRDQLTGLRHTIYQRCQQRSAYDEAQQGTRVALRRYYAHLLANLRDNPSPQSRRFNARLERDAESVRVSLDRALAVGAPRGCNAYK